MQFGRYSIQRYGRGWRVWLRHVGVVHRARTLTDAIAWVEEASRA
jgi:hypothetical protein